VVAPEPDPLDTPIGLVPVEVGPARRPASPPVDLLRIGGGDQ
jgi:hypothetical protein